MNDNLVPAFLVDLVGKYMQATHPSEIFALESRLNDIKEYIDIALRQKKNKSFK